jgi:calcineurin-like phosphoesterase family protein
MTVPKKKFLASDKVWHISDTHFGHENIIPWCQARERWNTRLGGEGVDAMDAEMISRWNSVVRPEDTVVHYGDFSWRGSGESLKILDALNGKKIFIAGNHDNVELLRKHSSVVGVFPMLNLCWRAPRVPDDPNSQLEEVFRIHASHFPIWDWDHQYNGAYHVHGHTHGKSNMPLLNSIDISFDAIRDAEGEFYLRPISTAELFEAIARKNQQLIKEQNPIAMERYERVKKALERNNVGKNKFATT